MTLRVAPGVVALRISHWNIEGSLSVMVREAICWLVPGLASRVKVPIVTVWPGTTLKLTAAAPLTFPPGTGTTLLVGAGVGIGELVGGGLKLAVGLADGAEV